MILKLGGLAIENTSLINSHFKGYIHKIVNNPQNKDSCYDAAVYSLQSFNCKL